jgi:haloalkane dehalogenase
MNTLINEVPALKEAYPFESQFCHLNYGNAQSAKLHFLDEGTGPVILMLHGNPTWSFYFRNCVHYFKARGFRCIVPDHMGCGLSDKPQDYTYTLEQRIQDIQQLLKHLEIQSFNVIVHDWGGAIGMGVATRSPESVEKIAILNSAAYLSKWIPWRIAFLRTKILGAFLMRAFNLFAGPAVFMSVIKPLDKNIQKGFLHPYQNWKDRIAVAQFVEDIPMSPSHPSYDCLAKVEKELPNLSKKKIGLFWGEKDFCFNKKFFQRWIKIFPTASQKIFPDAGHYVLEDAGEEILKELDYFLTQ